jgi:hypothetical protein
LGEAPLPAAGKARFGMASGAPALAAEPFAIPTVGLAFEGPVITAFKWVITGWLWGQAFNWTVVLATYGGDFWKHWYELLFFPITIVYRHAIRGVQRAIKPSVPVVVCVRCAPWACGGECDGYGCSFERFSGHCGDGCLNKGGGKKQKTWEIDAEVRKKRLKCFFVGGLVGHFSDKRKEISRKPLHKKLFARNKVAATTWQHLVHKFVFTMFRWFCFLVLVLFS